MRPMIYLVDDDDTVRESLSTLLETYGFRVLGFATAKAALRSLDEAPPDCVVLDVRMPEIDGLSAQSLLLERMPDLPIIMITGHGDVSIAVKAMKNGAIDFIEKPVDDEKLASAIRNAVLARGQKPKESSESRNLRQRFEELTDREKSVALLVLEGYTSSAISSMLGISSRTVDHHRASILAKMQATSLSQLIRMLLVAIQR